MIIVRKCIECGHRFDVENDTEQVKCNFCLGIECTENEQELIVESKKKKKTKQHQNYTSTMSAEDFLIAQVFGKKEKGG